MSRYTFSKGELEISNNRLTGWVKASTDFQHQMPSRIEIDTDIGRVGPFTISEVPQFRLLLTWSVLFPALSFVIAGSLAVAILLLLESYLGMLLGVVVGMVVSAKLSAVLGRKWFSVYMVQFSNNGQTVYVPYIKKTDHSVINDLNVEVKKFR